MTTPHLSRRVILASAATIPVIAATARTSTAAGPATSVDMEALLLAAQWDPVKPNTATTTGAAASVTAVETALAERGFLAANLVDGHFGTATRTAYRAWQTSLGFTGLAATGLPGPTSLTRLGLTLRRPVRVGASVTFRDHTFNERTRAMLLAAERRLALQFDITQGSYTPGEDPTSAGTHDGGGVVDIEARPLTPATRTAAARTLRQVGFAAWVRTPDQGNWPLHIHAVATSDTDLSPQAIQQVGAYYMGRNGLRNNGPDDGPVVAKRTFEDYQRGRQS